MKLTTTHIVLLVILCAFSCKKKNRNNTTEAVALVKTTDSTFYCLNDSITVSFLSRVNYKKALKNCKLTLLNREFTYGEYGLIGLRSTLENHFSKEELNKKKIIIKEVQWETKDQKDYIMVWYKKNKNNWLPIEAYRYSKSTQF